MVRKGSAATKGNSQAANLGFESTLWLAADKLRNNVDATEEDGEPFEKKMKRLVILLHEQQSEVDKLNAAIRANLEDIGYGL
jgi:MarR-like DNA-binding transcriptional regulator SgrR of sgrS sRNA